MIPDKYIKFPFDLCLNNFDFNKDVKNSIELPIALCTVQNDTISIDPFNVTYTIECKNSVFTEQNNLIIICTKDLGNLLDFTLHKLISNNITELADILIVDDRSIDNSIYNICTKHNISYLRIDNNKNIFNYSNLNNFAVIYAIKHNKHNVIFWNNDLWPSNDKTFSNLLDKHNIYQSNLSGTRLVYPDKDEYDQACGKYDHVMGSKIQEYFGTIQHGGIVFLPQLSMIEPNSKCWKPYHNYRYDSKDTTFATYDSPIYGVTGALHITSVNDFIDVGGLNPSMSHTMQDIDLCLRYIDANKKIMYLGSEYMFHAETITGSYHKTISNIYNLSDNILYEYLWMRKNKKLLGLSFIPDEN